MKLQQTIALAAAVTLVFLGTASGQETIHVTFDGPPQMPPGSARPWSLYSESQVGISTLSGVFTRRWSGDPVFPDDGSAYIQPRGSEMLFFTYKGGRTFTPVSVDLALYSTGSLEPVTIQFVGHGYSLSQIIATTQFVVGSAVDSEGRPAFQTFNFGPEFRDVFYLSVAPNGPVWSLDNLVVIPEPSTGALFALGALAFCLLRCRFTRSSPRDTRASATGWRPRRS